MKTRIAKQDLLDAVNKVKTVVSAKSALPILSHILVEAKKGQVRLSATDLKVSIECSVDATVDKAGSITVSSQRIASILSELPDADLTIEQNEGNSVRLTCGKIQTNLYSMSPDEFPPIRTFDDIEPLSFPQSMLKNVFLKTSYAISIDQARYNLTGLLFEISDGALTTVATDGRRMSLFRETEGVVDGVDVKVIIPGKMIHELERLLDSDEEVNVFIGENQAAFAFGNIRLVTQLIEGNFPNYEMVIPKNHDKEIIVNTESFTHAIRRARTMTNDKFNSVRFVIEPDLITLRVSTPEVGEHEEEIPVEYQGDKIEIAFNPDYILDVLKNIAMESVSIQLKDPMSPGVIKPYTEAPVDKYVNVVMPIRI